MPIHYRVTFRHTQQEFSQALQMQAINTGLTLEFHPRTRRRIQHPSRQCQEPCSTGQLHLHMDGVHALPLIRPHQCHPLPVPRMPSITHVQLSTVGVLSRGC